MKRYSMIGKGLALLLMGLATTCGVHAADDLAQLQKEVELLRKELKQTVQRLNQTTGELHAVKKGNRPLGAGPAGRAEAFVDNKYGPGLAATTGQGRLKIGGLVQIWYTSVQNDNRALFHGAGGAGPALTDSNEVRDNDGFQVRRAELYFTMQIHKYVTGYMMVDFAREISSPGFPYNQGFKTNTFAGAGAIGTGGGGVPNILQDAFVHFHGFVPHHDFTIGQYLPTFSQEDWRPNGALDFVERSFIGNQFARELGLTVHGSWIDNGGGGPYQGGGDTGRVQYWLSAFNGAGSFHQSAGQSQNRVDDNDQQDILATLLVRPVWNNETWGSLELAYSFGWGIHGESGPGTDGLGRRRTNALRHSVWTYYRPGGPVKGWWLKGEWAWVKDRNAPGAVLDLTTGLTQADPQPFTTTGWYFSTGYMISDSIFAKDLPAWFRRFEFTFRYQAFDNVQVADLVSPNQTDVFRTQAWTAGFNYHIRKDHHAKIQLNYNWVSEPGGGRNRRFHNVDNNSLMMNFQVLW